MLEIMTLEERIVLDGAVVDTINDHIADHPDAVQTQEQGQEVVHEGDAAAQQNQDYAPDVNAAPVDGAVAAPEQGSNVLVISSDVQNADKLAAAAQDGVITIVFDAKTDSLDGILDSIRDSLGGGKADSIGFAVHSAGDGGIALNDGNIVNDTTLAAGGDLAQFWTEIGDMIDEDGRIDLLSCSLTATKDGQRTLEGIEILSGRNAAASDDITANPESGGDWILESGDVDAESIYFDAQEIDSYTGKLVAEGALDTSFGTNGLVTFTPDGRSDFSVGDVHTLNDGKVLVAGYSNGAGGANYVVARYNADGSLDTTFGVNSAGYTLVDFTGTYQETCNTLDVDSKGNIILVGNAVNSATTTRDILIASLDSDGTLNTSFDDDGKALIDISTGHTYATGVAFDQNDKIVIAGHNGSDGYVLRLNADGSRDNSFDGDGLYLSGLAGTDKFVDLEIDSSNRIVVTGENGSRNFIASRISDSGVLDTSFGINGIATSSLGSSYAKAMGIQSDGKIVVAGYSGGYPDYNFTIARFNADGSADNSFGADSDKNYISVDFDNNYDIVSNITFQADGKILVSGTVKDGKNDTDVGIIRLWSDGTLDTSFDGDGKLTQDFGSNTGDSASGIAVNTDGTILQVGGTNENGHYELGMSKYFADVPSAKASSGSANYLEKSTAKAVDDAILIGDAQNSIAEATVKISTSYQDGDKLNFTNQNGISGSFESSTGILTLTGTTTVANYQAALRSVTFESTNEGGTSRDITFSLTDPDGYTSVTQTRNIEILHKTEGMLDIDFDSDGKNTTSFTGTTSGNASAIQSDGKIIVAGNSNNDFALARYNADGSLDTSFGTSGKITTNFSGMEAANTVTIQPDGKILIGGFSSGDGYDFCVARYNADGSLDTTFGGGDGYVLAAFHNGSGGTDVVTELTVLSDGSILAAGRANDGNGGRDFGLAKFTSAGVLDTSFGTNGVVSTDFAGSADDAESIAIQDDGKIVLAGRSDNGGYNVAVARYNADGSLDTSFDTDGMVTFNVDGSDYGKDVLVQKDGKIVVAGYGSNDFILARLNADGSLDTTFNTDGKLAADFHGGNDKAYSVAMQADGKLVVAGTNGFGDVIAGRWNTDGSIDKSFGSSGELTLDMGSVADEVHSVSIDADGNIILAGKAGDAFAISRHLAFKPSNQLSSGDTAYTERADPVAVDSGIILGDAQNELSNAYLMVAAGRDDGDKLNFSNQNGITGSYDSSTGILTLSGTATVAKYQAALRSVTFSSTNSNPTTNKLILFSLKDPDGNQSDSAIKTINVTATNDQPVATNIDQTQSYNENATSVAIDDIVITDNDTGEQVTATLTLADTATGSLTADSGKGETYDSNTGEWTITGSVEDVNAALADVSFTIASGNTADTTISVSIKDGGEDGTVQKNGTVTLDYSPTPVTPAEPESGGGTGTDSEPEDNAPVITDQGRTEHGPEQQPASADDSPAEGNTPDSGFSSATGDFADSAAGDFDGPTRALADLNQVLNALGDGGGLVDSYGGPGSADADLTQVVRALQVAPSSFGGGFGGQNDPLSINTGLEIAEIASESGGNAHDSPVTDNAPGGGDVSPAQSRADAQSASGNEGRMNLSGNAGRMIGDVPSFRENSVMQSSLTNLNAEVQGLRFSSQQADFSVDSLEKAVDQLSRLTSDTQGSRDARTGNVLSDMAAELTDICEKAARNGEDVGELLVKLDSASQALAR